MRSRLAHAIATLVLLTCLICPLIEVFDSWDHTLETGSDNEYALVILALSVGVAYSFARVISSPLRLIAVKGSCLLKFLAATALSFVPDIPISISPPAVALRV